MWENLLKGQLIMHLKLSFEEEWLKESHKSPFQFVTTHIGDFKLKVIWLEETKILLLEKIR